MSTRIIKLTTKPGHNLPGCAYLLFLNGTLSAVNWDFKRSLTEDEKDIVRESFPFTIEDLQLPSIFDVSEPKNKTAHEKLRTFCIIHKAIRGTAYTPKAQEKANIKNVVVTQSLMETYFNNTAYPLTYAKSINDYIKHYNYIRDLNKNGAPGKYPNEYIKAFEKSLQPDELPKYWAHLRSLGWVKNAGGSWTEPG